MADKAGASCEAFPTLITPMRLCPRWKLFGGIIKVCTQTEASSQTFALLPWAPLSCRGLLFLGCRWPRLLFLFASFFFRVSLLPFDYSALLFTFLSKFFLKSSCCLPMWGGIFFDFSLWGWLIPIPVFRTLGKHIPQILLPAVPIEIPPSQVLTSPFLQDEGHGHVLDLHHCLGICGQ